MIEILVGMIASGKSTWSKERARQGWITINDDDVVNAVHGGDYRLYDKDLKPLYKSVEDHILHSAVLMGKNVVIDRGLSISQKARARWIAIAKSLDLAINAVVFESFSPEIHACRRSSFGGRGHDYEYWLKVAERHQGIFQEPTHEEGFNDIKYKKWEGLEC